MVKLTLVPGLIGAIAWVGKQFGHRAAGLMSGFPIIGGPLVYFIYQEQGLAFARDTAIATLAGVVGLSSFSYTYLWLAHRYSWPWCLAAALLAYAGLGVAVAQLHWGPHGYCALALAVLLIQIRFSPARQTGLSPMRTTSAEVLSRMVLAAVLVILVTALAQRIGPEHTGVLTAFPIASTVIAVFSHQRYSSSHSIQSLKALKQGLLSLLLFFYVLAVMTAWLSFEQSFIAAVFAAVLLQTLVARLGRRAASG